MFKELLNKEKKICVIGLGYVGLPIALEFARKFSVIGFDIKEDRVEMMKRKIDPSNELLPEAFDGCDILFTANQKDLLEAHFYIIAVPTPLDEHNLPDLKPLLGASEIVGKVLKKGDFVVFESTVYPGCTEEDCLPILEWESGLSVGRDFKIGYSPERINPGDNEHTLTKIVKVVSGCDDEARKVVADVYRSIITAGIHEAESIKVAEAAKIIENTQRDVNIALMNELSIIFNRMKINIYDVLHAAETKWNFLRFYPGLVGGHCIGVDPYYLTFKAKEFGYHAQIINSGRFVNDSMGGYIAKQTVKKIIASGQNIRHARVLVMGVTFKQDVSDIRNSKVVDVVNELKSYAIDVDVVDPHASPKEVEHEYGFSLAKEISGKYSAVIVAVNHKDYLSFDEVFFASILDEGGIVIDVKGTYRHIMKDVNYWSL